MKIEDKMKKSKMKSRIKKLSLKKYLITAITLSLISLSFITLSFSPNSTFINSSPKLNQTFSIISPKSGDIWYTGGKYYIRWDTGGLEYENIRISIDLYKDDSKILIIDTSTLNDGYYVWKIPNQVNGLIFAGNNYQITLSDPHTGYIVMSNYFEIRHSSSFSITLTSPKSGDYFFNGETVNIRWTSTGFSSNDDLAIYLYKNSMYHSIITYSTKNNGLFEWYINPIITIDDADYQIMIEHTASGKNYLSGYFEIITLDPDMIRVRVEDIPIGSFAEGINPSYVIRDVAYKTPMCVDSNGYLYMVYSYTLENQFEPYDEIYYLEVSKSIDAGSTWELVAFAYDSDEPLQNPDIAIDLNTDYIYVAFEKLKYNGPWGDVYLWRVSYDDIIEIDTDRDNDFEPKIAIQEGEINNRILIAYNTREGSQIEKTAKHVNPFMCHVVVVSSTNHGATFDTDYFTTYAGFSSNYDSHFNPDIAIDGDTVLLTCLKGLYPAGTKVMMIIFKVHDTITVEEIELYDSNIAHPISSLNIEARNEQCMVVFQYQYDITEDIKDYDIFGCYGYLEEYNYKWSDVFGIATTQQREEDPLLTMDGDDNFWIGYEYKSSEEVKIKKYNSDDGTLDLYRTYKNGTEVHLSGLVARYSNEWVPAFLYKIGKVNNRYVNRYFYASEQIRKFSKPSIKSPKFQESIDDSTPKLDWETNYLPIEEVSKYEIQVQNINSGEIRYIEAGGMHTYYMVSAPLDDGTYKWKLCAYNMDNIRSDWSDYEYFFVDTIQPGIPNLVEPSNEDDSNDCYLFWEKVADEDLWYQIQVSDDPSFSSLVYNKTGLYSKEVDDPFAIIYPKPSDGTYYWKVRAGDLAKNWGDWSSVWSFNLDTSIDIFSYIPNLISPIGGAEILDHSFNLEWDLISSATSYWCQISDDSVFSNIFLNSVTSSSTALVNYLSDGIYYWRVCAKNTVHSWGNWSEIGIFEVDAIKNPFPLTPELYNPTNNSMFTQSKITLEWESVMTATKYHYQVSSTLDFYDSDLYLSLGTTDTYATTYNMPDGIYYWRVRAWNDTTLWGSWSDINLFTIDTTPSAFKYPPRLGYPYNEIIINDNKPYFTWSQHPLASQFHLQVDISPTFSSPTINLITGYANYTSSTLPNNEYFWRVRVKNSVTIWSPWSVVRSFEIDTSNPIYPYTPYLLFPENDITSYRNASSFSWSRTKGVTEYNLQIDNSITFSSLDVNITTSNSVYSIPTLPEGIYNWRVRAKSSIHNWGNWSLVGSYISNYTGIFPLKPILKTPVNDTTVHQSTNDFYWSIFSHYKFTGRCHFQISDGYDFAALVVNTTMSTTYNKDVTLADGTYYWRVRVRDDNYALDWGLWSNISKLIINTTVFSGIPSLNSPVNMTVVYSNSFNLEWVSMKFVTLYQVQVSNSSLFTTKIINDTTANAFYFISSLPNGNYFWRVRAKTATLDWGDWCAPARFVRDTAMPRYPIKPYLLYPHNSAIINYDTPYFEWSSLKNVEFYQIQISSTILFTSPIVNTFISTHNYTSAPLSEGKYYWRLRASNITNNVTWGSWSDIREFTINLALSGFLDVPLLLNPVNNSATRSLNQHLKWSSLKLATSYNLQVSNDTSLSTLITDTITELTDAIVIFSEADTFFWRVRAKCETFGLDWGPWSEVWQFHIDTRDTIYPDRPEVITPSNGVSTSDKEVELEWYPNRNATSYQIQISRNSTFSTIDFNETSSSFNYTSPTLSSGNYSWRVRSKDDNRGWGSWSTARSLIILEEKSKKRIPGYFFEYIIFTIAALTLYYHFIIKKRDKK